MSESFYSNPELAPIEWIEEKYQELDRLYHVAQFLIKNPKLIKGNINEKWWANRKEKFLKISAIRTPHSTPSTSPIPPHDKDMRPDSFMT
jgi:hypothetical protein